MELVSTSKGLLWTENLTMIVLRYSYKTQTILIPNSNVILFKPIVWHFGKKLMKKLNSQLNKYYYKFD